MAVGPIKIYRGDVAVTMELGEFLEILEANLFDDLLLMILELDQAPSTQVFYGVMDEDGDLVDIDLEDLVESGHLSITEANDFMSIIEEALGHEVNWEEVYDGPDMEISSNEKMKYTKYNFDWEDVTSISEEDAKVKRLVDKYRDIS